MNITRRDFTKGSVFAAGLIGFDYVSAQAQAVTAAEVRAIAKEAYIYGYPMVDSYRIEYGYFVDKKDSEYKGPWNEIHNEPNVYTPADKAIQTPNSDTPYSWLFLDLRTEPMVLTMPVIEGDRYFSVQLIDLYTFNFDYLGSRTTGNDGGTFLIAGPGWKGATPKGVEKVIRCETKLTLAAYRTQLFNPGDIDNVKKIQAGYRVRPFSAFLGTTAPKSAPAIDFMKPITHDEEKTSLQVFSILNFILQFCPTDPTETKLMARFAKIGIGAGKTFDPNKLSPEMKTAFEQGIADAWADFAGVVKQVDEGKVTIGRSLRNASISEEQLSVSHGRDHRHLGQLEAGGDVSELSRRCRQAGTHGGQPLYPALSPGQLPPVNAFWSLTMYELPTSLLVANPINRYLINSPMLPALKKDADGGLTLYIQNESPGKDKEPNWLPAPKGPFAMFMRLYWPKEEALDGEWKAPPLQREKGTGGRALQ